MLFDELFSTQPKLSTDLHTRLLHVYPRLKVSPQPHMQLRLEASSQLLIGLLHVCQRLELVAPSMVNLSVTNLWLFLTRG